MRTTARKISEFEDRRESFVGRGLEWKKIPENKTYSVSSSGDVKNNKTGKILKPLKASSKTYTFINKVFCGKKNYTLHSLVFKVFNGLPMSRKCFVTFLDGNPMNCSFKNLTLGIKKKKIKNLDGEKWLPSRYSPGYKISNMGRVSRHGFEVYLSWRLGGVGRFKERAFLTTTDGKQRWSLVKKDVYDLFVGKTPKNFNIYHVDYNIDNNRADNLSYKQITSEIAITTLENSKAFGEDDGVFAAIDILKNNDRRGLDNYFNENYQYFMFKAEQCSFGRDVKCDPQELVQEAWLMIPGVIDRGTYRGEGLLKYYICGIIKRLVWANYYTSDDRSIFHTDEDGGDCLVSDFVGIDNNTMDWDCFK